MCVQVSRVNQETGVHVNSTSSSSGLTCLHAAVVHSHVNMARLLLRRGAHINARTKIHRNTALHLACQSNSLQVRPVSSVCSTVSLSIP